MKTGLIITDFHSKERTKINRAPDWNRRYSKTELAKILTDLNLAILELKGMGHSPNAGNISKSIYTLVNPLFSLFMPPARWLAHSRKL